LSRAIRFAPLVLLVLLLAGLVWRLATPVDTNVSSKLAGTAVPAFALPAALATKPPLSSADLRAGKPRIVNVFASWCVPCITEVHVLQELKSRGVAIDGIAVRDTHEALADFLQRNGDPYERIGSDAQSRVQIALGSSGVPESFIVDGRGIIRYQHIGPIEASEVPMILAKLEQAR
jgi:cytochrome c biogenesis protein CcmG/thiol:disulfide interchange protein DsbE